MDWGTIGRISADIGTGGLYEVGKYAYDKSKEPYDKEAEALKQAGAQAKSLGDLQWQRQMQGLSQALGYVNHSQNAVNRVYGQPAAPPGSTVPQGLLAQKPISASSSGGLAAFLGRK